jgi:hypothetical protein
LSEPLGAVLRPFVAALEELQIPYYIGGSVASMTHGEYRMTADVTLLPIFDKNISRRLSKDFPTNS